MPLQNNAPARMRGEQHHPSGLANWCAPRGIDPGLMLDAGFTLETQNGFGPVAALRDYYFSNGEPARGRLLLIGDGHADREWRWEGKGGTVKGAVWVLGDAHKAEFVMIAEGESDALTAWATLRDDGHFAVICLPGSSFVPDDLANFIGTDVQVVIASDADAPGDKCAVKCAEVLRGAGFPADVIRRLRPDVPGHEKPDLRDMITHLRETATDPSARFTEFLMDAPAMATNDEPSAAPDASGSGPRAVAIKLSDVEPEPVHWLWLAHFARGKLTILDGDPDVGKSTLLLDIGARVSCGLPMPDGSPGLGTPEGVLLLASVEDGLADTIRPRLSAAGADLDRVIACPGIEMDGKLRELRLPDDIDLLRGLIAEHGIRLVIVDAVMAVLPGNVNSHKDQEVRAALHPLARLAEDTGVCVVLNRHFTKAAGVKAIHKGGGTVAMIGVARVGLQVFKDPEDATKRLLAVSKCNLVRDDEKSTLGFQLMSANVTIPKTGDVMSVGRVRWGEEDPRSADDIIRASERTEPTESKLDQAIAFLEDQLERGWQWSDEVKARWEGSAATLKRAYEDGGFARKEVGFGTAKRAAWAPPGYSGPWPTSYDETSPPHHGSSPMIRDGVSEDEPSWENPHSQAVPGRPKEPSDAHHGSHIGMSCDGANGGASEGGWRDLVDADVTPVSRNSSGGGAALLIEGPQATHGSRTVCKGCGDPWPGPGTLCDTCVDAS